MMIEKVKEIGNSKGVSGGSRNEETTMTPSNFESECRMRNGMSSCDVILLTANLIDELHVFEQLACQNAPQLWYEIATLTSTCGLMNLGGGSYDRSKFLSLYNNIQAISNRYIAELILVNHVQ